MQEKIHMLPLSDAQIEEQVETISYFLSSVHPSLEAKEGYRPCVELRPIYRGGKNYMLSKSLLIWDLTEKSVDRLRTFLQRHNGQPSCLFYSVFNYDNNKIVEIVDGKEVKAKKITSTNALYTSEIALDFDNIDFDAYVDLVNRFEALGIYAIWVSSGHGYQAHILLDKSSEDKDILKRFVYKFRSKGFDCDSSCIDPARLMRLPGTFNCKCFVDEAYADELDDPPACELVQESGHRYSEEFIMSQLDRLPTVSKEDDEVGKEFSIKPKGNDAKIDKASSDDDLVVVRRIEYPHLANFELPQAISKMLAYTPHGYRNKVLGFLIKHFKQQYRMSKTQIEETLRLWATEACEPAYDADEFDTDFKRLYYHYNGLKYDSALAKKFGVIDFGELIELRKQDITIPLKFFDSFAEIDGKAVRLYLGIKLLEHLDQEVTQESLSTLLSISERALRPTLQDLLKSNFVYIKKGNRRLSIPNTYHAQRSYSTEEGYMTFSYNDIRAYVMELYESGNRGNGELKLYLFMRWKFYSGEVFMSQSNLGQHIGVARNSISDMVYKLQDKHFLRIRKIKKQHYYQSCEYTLLR